MSEIIVKDIKKNNDNNLIIIKIITELMVDERGVLWVFQLTTLYLVGVNLFAIDTNIQIPYQYSDRLQDTKMFQKQHHHHLSLYREDRWGTKYYFKSNAGEKKRKKGWGGVGGAVQLRRCH